MTSMWFGSSHSYQGEDLCFIPVKLFPNGNSVLVRAIVDSGATISIFDKSLARRLGIDDITKGTLYPRPLSAANGGKGQAYMFDIDVEILGLKLNIPIGFCPEWPDNTHNLLGMAGFFDKFQHIAFDHRNRLLRYSEIP